MEILRVRTRSGSSKEKVGEAKEKPPSTPTDAPAKPTIAIDTREQTPFKFRADKGCAGTVRKKLDYGDYQVDGHPELIVVERKKSVDELCGNIGKHRARFERELQRMQACRWRYVVIEDYYSSIERPKFSKIHPMAILGSIISLELKYNIPFLFCGNRKTAHKMTKTLLKMAYKYRGVSWCRNPKCCIEFAIKHPLQRFCSGKCRNSWKSIYNLGFKIYQKMYYETHREETLNRCRKRHRNLKDAFLSKYGGKCACCGESISEFLCIDHILNDGSLDREVKGQNTILLDAVENYDPKRYQVLCFNCNCAKGFFGKCPHKKIQEQAAEVSTKP